MDKIDEQCLVLNITSSNGIWHGENPFPEALPLFITQLVVILIVSRVLNHLLEFVHQPRIVSDILGGILLGESALGKIAFFDDLFPNGNIDTMETLAYMALIFHMFLVGLELNLHTIGRITKRALIITVTGLVVPFLVGIGFFYLLHRVFEQDPLQRYNSECGFLWAAALAVTSFPTVGQILSNLELLNSEIGRLAMPIALISDLGSWILIVILIPLCSSPRKAPYVLITTISYLMVSFYTVRPCIARIYKYTSKGKTYYSDSYLCFVLVGVVLNAFVTDVTGTHPIVGAFIFGLVIPQELAPVLLDRFSYFVSGLMMPVFFTIAGIRVNIFKITKWSLVFVVVVLFGAVKIISFLPISLFSNIKTIDRFALGLLMSTKGIWAILIVLIGLEKKVLLHGDYAVTMSAILLMNSIVAPIIAAIYKRTNRF